jgi:hypothetical protein
MHIDVNLWLSYWHLAQDTNENYLSLLLNHKTMIYRTDS